MLTSVRAVVQSWGLAFGLLADVTMPGIMTSLDTLFDCT